jgi:hypothetical protein
MCNTLYIAGRPLDRLNFRQKGLRQRRKTMDLTVEDLSGTGSTRSCHAARRQRSIDLVVGTASKPTQ